MRLAYEIFREGNKLLLSSGSDTVVPGRKERCYVSVECRAGSFVSHCGCER